MQNVVAAQGALRSERSEPDGRHRCREISCTARHAGRRRRREISCTARTLYVVATPLGNLRDVTLRALDVLATVDVIAAEDTRVTAKLLSRYGLATRMLSLHAHNEAGRAQSVIARLAAGESVALVTDADTGGERPGRAPRPRGARSRLSGGGGAGACALTAAVSVAGLRAESFVFAGFPPLTPSRAALARSPCADAGGGRDVRGAASRGGDRRDIVASFGDARTLVVAREITKAFETIALVRLGDAPAWFGADANRVRGDSC